MNSNGRNVCYKVSKIIEIYNFYFGHLIIWKIWTFQIWNFKKWQVRTKIWDPKWFQHKKWWIPKLFNLLISTTFLLVILSFDKIWTFQIWNFEKWQVRTKIWDPNWFQRKKWWIPKLSNSWISTTFILVISSFDKFLAHIVH